jgi:general secretion pathway protein A
MYESFWGFPTSPFTGRLNTRWFHQSPVHEEALARLFYLIEQQRGFGLLSGASGTGKSLTLKYLCEQVRRSQRRIAFVDLMGLDAHQMLWQLALQLDLAPSDSESRWSLWRRVTDQVLSLRMARLQTVFVFDHFERADSTCHSLLERLFWTAEADSGMATFITSVRSNELPRLSGMLGELSDLRVELTALDIDETIEFVDALLTKAGTDRSIFSDDAFSRLHSQSCGIPRQINRICELALIAGMAAETDTINGDLVDSVADGLVPTVRSSIEPVEYHQFV